MLEAFKKPRFSQEQIEGYRSYIQNLVDTKTFEEVEQLAKSSWQHVKIVMNFFMLPKTELHEQFREKFIKPAKQRDAHKLEWIFIGKMKENKQLFIKEHLIDSYQYNDVKYQIINRTVLHERNYHWEWEITDIVLHIAIPYFSQQAWRDKFWYSMEIYHSKTPEFFDRLVNDMKTYQWNAALTSNRK